MEDLVPLQDDNLKRKPGEDILAYTQRIRESMVETLTAAGVSNDPKDIAALNSVLDGIDRQEINKAKIQIESEAMQADKQAFDIISAIVNQVGNSNPYLADKPIERDVSAKTEIIDGVTLLPGEFDHAPKQLNYDSFMKEYKAKHPKSTDDESNQE